MQRNRVATHRGSGTTRRRFLRTTAAFGSAMLAAPYLVPSSVFGANAPSNRIHVGFIGLGNQSTLDLPAFLGNDDVQVLAVCDVNTASHGYKDDKQLLGRKPGQDKVASRARTRSTPTTPRKPSPASIKGATPTSIFARSSGGRISTPWRSWCPTTGTP
jgi:hypothetical protein